MMVDARTISRPFRADAGARTRLKRETDDLHRQVEAAFDAAGWLASIATYRTLLERWDGLLRGFETALGSIVDAAEADLAIGGRLRHLTDDLSLLTSPGRADALASHDLPRFGDKASAFGCLYVLEGSALGGRVLAKRARDRLGPDVPTAFLSGHGAETGPLWLAFLGRLDRALDSEAATDRAVAAARQTFTLVGLWLTAR